MYIRGCIHICRGCIHICTLGGVYIYVHIHIDSGVYIYGVYMHTPLSMCICTYMCTPPTNVCVYIYAVAQYGVATISRLLKMIGLFCKRAL